VVTARAASSACAHRGIAVAVSHVGRKRGDVRLQTLTLVYT
jgi:hypothetical protein